MKALRSTDSSPTLNMVKAKAYDLFDFETTPPRTEYS